VRKYIYEDGFTPLPPYTGVTVNHVNEEKFGQCLGLNVVLLPENVRIECLKTPKATEVDVTT